LLWRAPVPVSLQRSRLVPSGFLALAAAVGACADDAAGPTIDARESVTDAGLCPTSPHPPSGGCEVFVGARSDCPSLEDVCAGLCGVAHECCFCGDDGQWSILYTDCPPCPDASADAP
jgi:hypothetical protein